VESVEVEADAERVKEFVVLKIFPIVKFLAFSASMLNTYVRNLVEVGMNVPVEARTDAWWYVLPLVRNDSISILT